MPLADNDYGMPACCNMPNLCQGYRNRRPSLDQLNGTGSHPMNGPVFTNSFWLPNVYDGGATRWVAHHGPGLCHGHTERWSMSLTTAGFIFIASLDLYAEQTPAEVGNWFTPVTSPSSPGQSVVLAS